MVTKEFKYVPGLSYPAIKRYSKKNLDLTNREIHTSNDGSFKVSFQDIFEGYKLPYTKSEDVIKKWNSTPGIFWQNQLHFAIWCATTGCGVSIMHLNLGGLMGSLYNFHVYYQTRRILKEIQVPLPQDPSWNPLDNTYDQRSYERICNEFGVPSSMDWRQKEDDNQGLGRIYQWLKGSWRHKNPWIGGYYAFDWGVEYDPKRFTLTGATANQVIHIDFIAQGKETERAWTTFILDHSEGFTRPGISRLNESIRTYSWSLIDSQVSTRTSILGTGTAFDAQKQFIVNLEDSIDSPVDLPEQIKKYQDTLRYARSKVNFVFGIGLYMCPGNLEMQIGVIQDYNNEIVIATDSQSSWDEP